MLTVKDYEEIRRLVLVDGVSQREAASRLGHSRKTISKALEHSEPPGYRRGQPYACPAVDPVKGLIASWLEEDTKAPRKQRHTAQRIFERLRAEHGFTGSASAVRRYVSKVRRRAKQVYVPQSYEPGEEAQFDWGEAKVYLNGVLLTVYLFCVRLCHSKVSFVRAYPHMQMEAFLDGHVQAFEFFGGVPHRAAYDNLKSAVVSIGRKGKRRLNDQFIGLRSYYLFDSRFCNVESGWEKGHVENLVKLAQRSFMTPIPHVTNLDELNEHLLAACERFRDERAEAFAREAGALRPLPAPYSACVTGSTFSDSKALVQVKGSLYSVPSRYANGSVQWKLFVDRLEIYHGHMLVATHDRCPEAGGRSLIPWHYVPILARKPGAFHNGEPFREGSFGPIFERLHRELLLRYDDDGTRRFIGVLLLHEEYGIDAVIAAVERCVQRRAFSDDAVRAELRFGLEAPSAVISLCDHPHFQNKTTGIRPATQYDGVFYAKEAQA